MPSRKSQPPVSIISLPNLPYSTSSSKPNSNNSGGSSGNRNQTRQSFASSTTSYGHAGSGSFGKLGQSVASGDSTGTKGFGTGNDYEGSRRSTSMPGAYGHSTGTKGFGTGNDFEHKVSTRSTRANPPGSSRNTTSNFFRSHPSIPEDNTGSHDNVDYKTRSSDLTPVPADSTTRKPRTH
ncbi:hypothetical protein K435DRAFT_874269 [Dendrothele bispora CBS 962.96]|uniref:Uncharacterized protein n=1 Tax=Dendrothele bispora (strain CBS 962.96) TaxID=1314807 RepID=A0A4S8KX26_DENBC|nr:hypothetical protein K435DRAFT_874269 [Dendrothele bispora CBS 962.96]